MRLASSVNLSDFKENGVFTEESYARYHQYTEDYFALMQEVKPKMQAGICSIKGRINERIQGHNAKAYDKVLDLVESAEYERVCIYDSELMDFKTATKIYQAEENYNDCIFTRIEYIEHFQEIYKQMKYFYRRIQLQLPLPLQEEIMDYIEMKQLSIYAVLYMLVDSGLGGKETITLRLADFYLERQETSKASFLLSAMEELARPEWKEIISEKMMMIP